MRWDEKGKEANYNMTTRSTHSKLSNVIWESKHIRVMFQGHDKMTNRISSQIPVLVISFTLM